MKASLYFLSLLVSISIISPKQASACSVLPVDPTQEKNDLVASALTNLGVSIENVNSVDVADYAGDYIWTPMCPRGLTSNATFTISFNNIDDELTKGCTAIVKVSKNWIYKEGLPKYTHETIQAATCLE